ncbi:MAG TPA: aspartate aminotransferase family protein [Phycisphaerae bacterium]|nr:aspartate aminotransferase family protein [Phycisphaerae bacterium]HRW55698.1 aspartate aminotransferase family protein [Phycisphaerae bacterium]
MTTTNTTPKRIPLPVCNHKPAPYNGPSKEQLLALRREYLNPGILTYYKDPIAIVEGHMQYLWDETGKQYLDAFAGIVTVSVGHCHPKITERIREQVGQLVHTTTIYLHPNVVQFAEALAKKMPAGANLKQTYFTNSGSEANELAITMARLHTGRHDVISLRNCYHGGSTQTMGLTAVGTWKYPLPSPAGIKNATPGYCYRCPYGLEYPSCDVKCARDVEDMIRYETCGEVAAFIAEPIQGVGGTVVPPPEYYGIVYDIVRRYGGLCIADEVQTGFGRTGAHYWGHQNWGVTPDMVTMAKGIGNGAPLGACTTRPEIAETMKQRLHFNTFGGNPVSAIQGMSVLEIIDEEKIQQRAAKVGGYLKDKLTALMDKHALIGEVRGMGLMLGVELVKDRQTKEPASAEAGQIVELAKDRGLLMGKGGLYGNTLRIKPPMCIREADCDFMVDCLDGCLEEVG